MPVQDDMATAIVRRLNALRLARFEARGSEVVIGGAGSYVPCTPVSAGRGRPYEVERALAEASGYECAVVCATEFTPGALSLLKEASANYMDRRRLHVRLPAPEFYVDVVDQDEVIERSPADTRVDLSGARGAVAIGLLDPLRDSPDEAFRITELAEKVHVAVGTVQNVFRALENEGLLEARGRGPLKTRVVTDASTLLDRYASDAARDRRLAVTCRVLVPDPRKRVETVQQALRDFDGHLTGSAAASLMTDSVTAVPVVELWVHGSSVVSPALLVEAVDGDPRSDSPNVVMWRATTPGPLACVGEWPPDDEVQPKLWVASKFRIYADLLANPQRGREQAALFREQAIGF